MSRFRPTGVSDEGVVWFADADQLADAATAWIADELHTATQSAGAATLAVPGGGTPGPIFDRLSRQRLAWDRVTVTLVDDRWVEPDHPDSNARLVAERLLVGRAAKARFEPLKRGRVTPELDAEEASVVFGALPPLDVVLLGMGEDGHVASLFPGSPALAAGLDPEGGAAVVAAPPGGDSPPAQPRLSLTLPVLTAARTVMLVFAGAAKLATLQRARAGEDLPVTHLLRQRPRLTILYADDA